jgi:hypothetical protein
MDKIRFRDLSMPLKVLVVIAWIVAGLNAILFLIAFLIGASSIFGAV